MEDIYETRAWHSSNVNDYANSTISSYLNSTWLNLIDANIRNAIKQVKIPYRPGSGTSGTVNSGANGLSCKIFLLSDREVGYTKSNVNQYICDDGAKLAYFQDGNGTAEKIAKYNGSATLWWLRSPYCNSNNGATNALNVNTNGNWSNNNCSNGGYAIRPALMGNEMSRQEPAENSVPSIKGSRILSFVWAQAFDKYIIPRQAAPARGAVGYRGEADRY